jgi:hypothetical protein
MSTANKARLRSAAGKARNQTQFMLGLAGFAHSSERLTRDASMYWSGAPGNRWRDDSHWRSGSKFQDTGLWAAMGQEHLQLFGRLRETARDPAPLRRIVDWGCGGGANAVSFAPLAEEYVGADVNAESLTECARQVGSVCSTPFVEALVDIADPEKAAREIPRSCDLFLCLYSACAEERHRRALRVLPSVQAVIGADRPVQPSLSAAESGLHLL